MIWAKLTPVDQRRVRDYLLGEPSCSETALSLSSKLGLGRSHTRRALDQLVDEGLMRRRELVNMEPIYYRYPTR